MLSLFLLATIYVRSGSVPPSVCMCVCVTHRRHFDEYNFVLLSWSWAKYLTNVGKMWHARHDYEKRFGALIILFNNTIETFFIKSLPSSAAGAHRMKVVTIGTTTAVGQPPMVMNANYFAPRVEKKKTPAVCSARIITVHRE